VQYIVPRSRRGTPQVVDVRLGENGDQIALISPTAHDAGDWVGSPSQIRNPDSKNPDTLPSSDPNAGLGNYSPEWHTDRSTSTGPTEYGEGKQP